MSRKRLNEIYNQWLSVGEQGAGAVFVKLVEQAERDQLILPWGNDTTFAFNLDFEYIGNHSGEKLVSNLVENLYNPSIRPEYFFDTISQILLNQYLLKWQKLWDTMFFEYNPIENYDMTENLSDDELKKFYGKSNTRTDNLNSRNAGTTRNDPNVTDTESVNTFGFNTDTPEGVPSEKRTSTRTGSDVDTVDISRIDTGSQTFVDGGSDREEHHYTLTRKGNIGVTTSQQMIQSERDLQMWDYFFKVVFPDIDRVLTIKIY